MGAVVTRFPVCYVVAIYVGASELQSFMLAAAKADFEPKVPVTALCANVGHQ